jgi:hypothetical protein
MSHIKNTNTTNNITLVPITTSTFKNQTGLTITSTSNGFKYKLANAIHDVDSMYIDSAVFPETLYNVNNDQIVLYYNIRTFGDGANKVGTISLLDDGIFTSNQQVVNALNNYIDSSESHLFSFSYGDLYKNKFVISYTPVRLPNYFQYNEIGFTSLAYDIGFSDIATGNVSIITDKLDIPSTIIITESNNILSFKKNGNVTTNIIFKSASYNIYNIVYEINKQLEAQGFNTNGEKCAYSDYSDKLFIIVNYLGSNEQVGEYYEYIEFDQTPLADTLKLSNKITNLNFVADFEVDYDKTTLQLIDYTKWVIESGTKIGYLSTGFYTIQDIINTLNATQDIIDSQITFGYDAQKIRVYTKYIYPDITYRLSKCGIFRILGIYEDIAITPKLPDEKYYLPSMPKLYTRYINVNSMALTTLKTDYTHGYNITSNNIIGSIPYNIKIELKFDPITNTNIYTNNPYSTIVYNNTNMTKNLFSRKTSIQEFDIYFTDDDDKIVNLNGSDVSLQMVMLS